jgi:hypothetical protein
MRPLWVVASQSEYPVGSSGGPASSARHAAGRSLNVVEKGKLLLVP